MQMKRKGISPLIAAVLLIAVTMAIAGVMASWATQFSSGRLIKADQEANCIGSLDISSLKFENMIVSLKIRNIGYINLTNLRSNIEYADPAQNKLDLFLKDFNISDPLKPGSTTFFIYNTSTALPPDKIEIFSENCKAFPASLVFR